MYTNHEKYALVNGVMLDGTRDMTPRTGLAVCVDGDRIAAVCDAADVPEGYARVDLGGKYLLPGADQSACASARLRQAPEKALRP